MAPVQGIASEELRMQLNFNYYTDNNGVENTKTLFKILFHNHGLCLILVYFKMTCYSCHHLFICF